MDKVARATCAFGRLSFYSFTCNGLGGEDEEEEEGTRKKKTEESAKRECREGRAGVPAAAPQKTTRQRV